MEHSIFLPQKVKLGFLITQNCNFKCKHCLNRCPFDQEISVADYVKILDLFAGKIDMVAFSGGEAALHTHFEEIIAETVKRELRFTIVSNGYLHEQYAFLLAHKELLKSLAFSLDGLQETHDFIRRKGSFDHVMEAIDFYKSKGVKVKINYTISKQGFDEVEEVIALLADKKVDEVDLGAVIANGVNQEFILSVEKRAQIYRQIPDYLKRYPKLEILASTALYVERGVEGCANLVGSDTLFFNQNAEFIFCCNIAQPYAVLSKIEENNLSMLVSKKESLKKKIWEDRIAKRLGGTLYEIEVHTCEYCNQLFKRLGDGITQH